MEQLSWESFSLYLFEEKRLDRGKKNEYSYKYLFNKVQSFFSSHTFNREGIRQFLHYLRIEKGLSESSVLNHLMLLKHVAIYLNVDDIKYFKIKKPKNINKKRILTPQELDILFHTEPIRVRNTGWVNKRMTLIIKFAYFTAARSEDVINLKWENVFEDFVIFEDTKSGEDQTVYVLPEIIREMRTLPKFPHEYVFGSRQGKLYLNTFNDELKLRGRKGNILNWEMITTHCLRHSRATHAAKEDVNLGKIQKFLRHKDPGTTMQYVHLNMDDIKQVAESSILAYKYGYVNFNTIRMKTKKFYESLQGIPFFIQMQETEDSVTFTIINKERSF